MSKIAIVQIPLFIAKLKLKKHVLMFDKIVFVKENYDVAMQGLEMNAKNVPDMFRRVYNTNKASVEYLQNVGLLQFITINELDTLTYNYHNEISKDEELTREWVKLIKNEFFKESKNNPLDTFNYDKFIDFVVRLSSSILSKINENETIPMISQFPFSEKTKKQVVYRYLLKSIPEPKDSVSWQQLFDFKKDTDTQKKYYRIINWINQISRAEIPLNEIEDKYKELLFEYQECFRIHRMKYNLSSIEFVTKIVVEIASLQFSKAHETFFSIFKQEVDLLDAERKFGGKEIAYIHKLSEEFGK